MRFLERSVFVALAPSLWHHLFPHLAPGTASAIHDISIVNHMQIIGREVPRQWRRPDGKLERIIYPPRPTVPELVEQGA